MQWTSTAPTEAGWYWYRAIHFTAVLSVRDADGALLAYIPGHYSAVPVRRMAGQWAGPIVEPA